LVNFGTTFVERAMIEAVCRRHATTFSDALRRNLFGIRLGDFDERLRNTEPADWLPAAPRANVVARHTLRASNPLTDDDITEANRLDDGLPQTLVDCIRQFGLRHFKIKATGKLPDDLVGMSRMAAIISREAPADFKFTLDANEHFRTFEEFRAYW